MATQVTGENWPGTTHFSWTGTVSAGLQMANDNPMVGPLREQKKTLGFFMQKSKGSEKPAEVRFGRRITRKWSRALGQRDKPVKTPCRRGARRADDFAPHHIERP